jgi:hypothetical protein
MARGSALHGELILTGASADLSGGAGALVSAGTDIPAALNKLRMIETELRRRVH